MDKVVCALFFVSLSMIYYPLVASSGQEKCYSHLQRLFQAELDALRHQYGFPGATAAYIMSDGTIGVAATGFADIEEKIEMKPESRMLAASIGKSFVAATVIGLAKEGKLRLDDPISKWMGTRKWFTRLPNHSEITIRHLLTHSSGLPDHVHLQSFLDSYAKNWQKPNPFSHEELIGFVLDQPAEFPAGKGYHYTDTGYIVLGLIVEAVTGHGYDEEVTQRFLLPLHLDATSPSDRVALPGLASGYTSPNNEFGLPIKTTVRPGLLRWDPSFEWTGGGLISNPRDLAAWAKTLYEGHAMKAEYRNDLLQSVPIEEGIRYGAGVAIKEKGPLGVTYGHAGRIPGYISIMRYYPKYKVAIACQINTDANIADSPSTTEDIEQRLSKVVLGKCVP